jgi:hypothetical protein
MIEKSDDKFLKKNKEKSDDKFLEKKIEKVLNCNI